MLSLFIREKLYIGGACWAFLFGVIIGPYGAGIFDLGPTAQFVPSSRSQFPF
ncbi:hypothetical protein L210DRAFT_720712 [Boletus edulis BED1]|uniref:Uncharacterized protein n=1 Tax=Boletus edulis BED1 TaxID=1328754 RepID=A0AAD4BG03_BOLED|nr:hypothetical protein L210DRAFT_720712 [Boletus edulis BED1]